MTDRLVPNEPLRQAALKHGDYHGLAVRLGYQARNVQRRACPCCGHRRIIGEYRVTDSHRVKRDLGLKPVDGRLKQGLAATKALAYCEALGLLPKDVGL